MVLKQLVERAASHPKMEALLKVVLHHFKPCDCAASDAAAMGVAAGGDDKHEQQPGRVIIFTNRRDSVQSIVDMLHGHEPTVTAR